MTSALERIAAPTPPMVTQTTAVEQSRAVAEVMAAVMVAQQCPRDMRRAEAEMRQACGRLDLAQRAFYAVPNRGSGKSVHLARELARIWGNIDHGVRELRRDEERGESEVQAFAWDQQANVRNTRGLIVPHARMKKGNREVLVDLGDVYLNNQNIGARAVRECIYAVLPADFVAAAEDICRATLNNGDGKPLETRIAEMVAAYAKLGVTVPRIEARLEKKRGQWDAADVAELGVVYRSISNRELTVAEAFPDVDRVSVDELAPLAAPKKAAAKAAKPEPLPEAGEWPEVAKPADA